MKKMVLISVMILLCELSVFGQTCEWAEKIAGSKQEGVHSIAVDSFGNVYIAGDFYSDTLNFNNNLSLYKTGNYDAFIAKYNLTGTCLWVEKISGENWDLTGDIVIDGSGNIYLSGYFGSSTLNFNNGISLNNNSSYGNRFDIFLAKYNTSGICQWAENIAGTKDEGAGIVVDCFGNIYLAGYFYSDTLNFNNGIKLNNSGLADTFIAKYNSSGICQWAESFKGSDSDYAAGITVDKSGNIYVAGHFSSTTLTFNNGKYLKINGDKDAYIAKFDSSGTCLWANRITGSVDHIEHGGVNDNIIYGIIADDLGNIYVAGQYLSLVLYFNNNISIKNSNSNGMTADAFISKYNSNGDCQWAEKIAGTDHDIATSIALDSTGNLYVVGTFGSEKLILNNGKELINSGSGDTYIAKYNSSGICQWAEKISGSNDLVGIAVNVHDNFYVAGYFRASLLSFNNGISLTNMSNFDGFVAKYNSTPNSVSEESIKNNIYISPNPANDYIEIQPLEGFNILIFNTLGETVLSVEQTPPSVHRINISNLTPGLYFIKIGDRLEKFVKL